MTNRWEKMPDEIYHERPELSSSQLRKFMKSPYSYIKSLERHDEPTDAMRFGSAAHLALLQPDEFGNQVIVAPQCDRRTKEGKAIWETFQASVKPGTLILKEVEWKQASQMANEIRGSREFAPWVADHRHVEIAGFATIDGIECRIKPDMLGKGWMLDYKTTTSCSAAAFNHSVMSFGYVVQAAFYCIVAEAIDGEPMTEFYFIAQEKAAPYEWKMYRLDALYLQHAKNEVREALKRFALCKALNDWPKVSKEVVTLSLPRWYDGTSQLFGETAEGEE